MSTVAEIEAAIETLPPEKVAEVFAWLQVRKEKFFPAVRGDFRSAIGSYYRDYPDEPVRDAAEWLRELREGEGG